MISCSFHLYPPHGLSTEGCELTALESILLSEPQGRNSASHSIPEDVIFTDKPLSLLDLDIISKELGSGTSPQKSNSTIILFQSSMELIGIGSNISILILLPTSLIELNPDGESPFVLETCIAEGRQRFSTTAMSNNYIHDKVSLLMQSVEEDLNV